MSESGDRVLDETGLGVAAPGEAWARVREARSWDLTARQLCDLELLLNGAFAPLAGFMSAAEYEGVLRAMRLPSGALWPIPVTLDVSEAFAAALGRGETIALRDGEGVPVAVMEVGETWRPGKVEEARAVYGTVDDAHPGVSYLLHRTHPVYASGRVFGLDPVPHYDHRALRHSPAALRERFRKLRWRRVVAFQTRNPLHRAHVELAREAMRACEANLLLHPVVGETAPGDIDRYTRVRCYRRVLGRFPRGTVTLSLLNLAMRMAGSREALWHAIVRRNHGCTHFIVGRDHAAPGARRAFYGPYDAQALMAEHEDELGIAMVAFQEVVYAEKAKRYLPARRVADGDRALSLSGAELRRRLAMGLEIPDWFTFPEVAQELRRAFPPRHRQGFAVLFTGLSGAGKSTLANALAAMLRERGARRVTLLDGDVVRRRLSSELGFSGAHRQIHLRRIGFVAAEIRVRARFVRKCTVRDSPLMATDHPTCRAKVQSLPPPSSGAAATVSVSLSLFKGRPGGTREDADKRQPGSDRRCRVRRRCCNGKTNVFVRHSSDMERQHQNRRIIRTLRRSTGT